MYSLADYRIEGKPIEYMESSRVESLVRKTRIVCACALASMALSLYLLAWPPAVACGISYSQSDREVLTRLISSLLASDQRID